MDAPATFTRAICIALGLLLASCQPVQRAAAKGERTTVVVEDGRVVAHTGAEAIVLSEGLAAAGEPDLSFDGASVVFTGRRDGSSPPRLFVATLDGAQRHELDTGRDEPRTPCFLPDGGVVYATCDANGHLAAVGGTRSAPVRLTYGPGAQRDPTLLPDGRVLYVDVAAAGTHLAGGDSDRLLAVHVDGTGVAPYADLPAASWKLRKPRVRSDGKIELFGADRCADAGHQGEQRLLVDAARRGDEVVVIADVSSGALPLVALVAGARARPSLHLSLVDPTKTTGELFAVDVRRSSFAALRDAADGAVARVVVHRDGAAAPLGEGSVAADGSFYLRVPADTPLTLALLDAEGRTLAVERHAFWIRPGERRGCVGCHEERLTAPPNRRPLALAHDAEAIPAPRVSNATHGTATGGGP